MSATATTTDLALPGTISETALTLPSDLSFDEWQQAGEMLGRISRACQWWIGDWINFGEARYGEKYTQAMETTGYEYSTLNSFRYVAQQIEPVRRRTNVSFTHHAEVAALEPAEQDRWLEHAEREDLSRNALRGAIKGTQHDDDSQCCPTCGRKLLAAQQLPRRNGK